MPFGICPLSVVPVRGFASHHSELHSQLLFGEMFEIQDSKGKQWLRIRTVTDGVEGWIEQTQCQLLSEAEFLQYREQYAYSLELVHAVMASDHFLPVTIGARFPRFDGLHFRIGDTVYTFSGQTLTPGENRSGSDFLLKMARRYLGAPYLMGGRSPFGIDAPGFTQLAFQFVGVPLPRSSAGQIEAGEAVDFIENARPGDLAFFENKFGKINHVGIVMPEGRVIHALGSVRIDLLDHFGVFDESRGYYSRRLRLIKRILPTEEKLPAPGREEREAMATQVALF
jgi:hypothetical protein